MAARRALRLRSAKLLPLLLLLSAPQQLRSAPACPAACRCISEAMTVAFCEDPELDHAPAGLPSSLWRLTLRLPLLSELGADSLAALDAPRLWGLSVGGGVEAVSESAFAQLRALAALDLRDNRLSQLDPDAFPESLLSLQLSGNPLQLPSSGPLLRAANLTTLKLDRCGLTELPPQLLAELPQLEELSLRENQLMELGPAVLAAVPSLRQLNLGDNASPLRLHPDALAANGELETLVLENTRLQFLPDKAGDGRLLSCASLRTLQLGNASLGSAAAAGWLRGLPQLQYLHLEGNGIEDLPEDLFGPVPQLISLDLSGNRLTALPPALLAPLSQLQWLSLARNSLGSDPDTGPPQLQLANSALGWLSLANNELAVLPAAALEGAFQLRVLDLSGNLQLQLEPAQLRSALPQLQRLALSDNLLVCPCVQAQLRAGWPPGSRAVRVHATCEGRHSQPC